MWHTLCLWPCSFLTPKSCSNSQSCLVFVLFWVFFVRFLFFLPSCSELVKIIWQHFFSEEFFCACFFGAAWLVGYFRWAGHLHCCSELLYMCTVRRVFSPKWNIHQGNSSIHLWKWRLHMLRSNCIYFRALVCTLPVTPKTVLQDGYTTFWNKALHC